MTGLWVALAAIAVAVAFGAYRARTDGRFRAAGAGRAATASAVGRAASAGDPDEASAPTNDSGDAADAAAAAWSQLGDATGSAVPGPRATLVQFSSAFCAPCRVTRRVLSEVADVVPGVVHVEIDAERHLEVVRRLDIVRTPTTLILDRAGREVARAAGAPRKEQVLAAIPAADLT